jgi:hypothetical protein
VSANEHTRDRDEQRVRAHGEEQQAGAHEEGGGDGRSTSIPLKKDLT